MPGSQTIFLYWDAQCPFCAAIAARLARYDTQHVLRLVDYHLPGVAATAAPRFSFDDLDREMHVRMPDGTWRIGYFAWAAVLKSLSGCRMLGGIMEFAIFADIGPRAYRWIADHRLAVSKLLGLPAPCTAGSACRIDGRL